MFLGGDESHDLDFRCQAVVGQGHAKLIFEIREDPQASHNHMRPNFPAKFNGQSAESDYFN